MPFLLTLLLLSPWATTAQPNNDACQIACALIDTINTGCAEKNKRGLESPAIHGYWRGIKIYVTLNSFHWRANF